MSDNLTLDQAVLITFLILCFLSTSLLSFHTFVAYAWKSILKMRQCLQHDNIMLLMHLIIVNWRDIFPNILSQYPNASEGPLLQAFYPLRNQIWKNGDMSDNSVLHTVYDHNCLLNSTGIFNIHKERKMLFESRSKPN